MKKFSILFSLLTTLIAGSVFAQSESEMKAWQAYMTPGEVHKMIAESDGEWTEDITMWMDPAAPPTRTVATSKSEMIMGGRYQVSKTTGNMMGMPFEGMSVMGYDNTKKMFTSVWVDNFGTGTLVMEGGWDNASKSITFKGKMLDPMTGKEVWTRQVIRFIDKDHQEIEMFDTKNGAETKTMEIKLARKK